VRGRMVDLPPSHGINGDGASEWANGNRRATGQFEVSDDRSPQEIANLLQKLGYEPVWKDWDVALAWQRA
jgi:2-iminoacetate synthase ThiH